MASSSDYPAADFPDLHHPFQYRRLEARWKQKLSHEHLAFCSCGNFLLHFKWPSGDDAIGGRGGAVTVADAATCTGEDEDIQGGTGGGEGDISDRELLQ
uniref:ORF2 n=1 Tax=Torque teno Leptonychotes weddellii virus-1 TaxID=2012676 RepID=A0A1Z2RWW1_9VIRU|nr:ORF2 [Torque teno Leptonychotes weddellii virus 1]